MCSSDLQAALLLHAVPDEINDRIGDGFTKFLGEGSFAVAEEGEEDEARLRDLVAAAPRTILVLGLLEPTQRFDHRFLALSGASILREPPKSICLRATLPHIGRNIAEAAAATIAATSPTLAEVVAVSKLGGGNRIHVGYRDRGGRGDKIGRAHV